MGEAKQVTVQVVEQEQYDCDGPFYFGGTVLDDRYTGLRCREKGDAASVAEFQRASHVSRVKDVFDRHALGVVPFQQGSQSGVNRFGCAIGT